MRTDPRQNLSEVVGVTVLTGLLLVAVVTAAPAEKDPADPAPATPVPADLVVSSQVDKTRLTMDEPLMFSVTIAGPIQSAPRVAIESLKAFQVLSTGQSQQVTVRGGQTQLAITLEYLLAPLAPGRQTLGPVVVEHEGKRYQTTPIEVEVVEGKGRSRGGARSRPGTGNEERPQRPPLRGGTVL